MTGGGDMSEAGAIVDLHIKGRWRRIAAHGDTTLVLVGLVIGLGVCWPMLGGRPLFLLDWVVGPHPAWPSTAMVGLDGGLTTGVLGGVIMTLLVRGAGEAVTWAVLLAFFPVAALGAGRLVGVARPVRAAGAWLWGPLAAATLYCVNPWVFNRIYAGQLALLAGYALLPFAVASALKATENLELRRPVGWIGPVLWWAALTAISPHYVWIYGVVLVAVVVVSRPWNWRLVAWLATSTAAMAVLSLYILLPHGATRLPTKVGAASLEIYRTSADPHLGLLPNVAALYGFWRIGPGPVLPKNVVAGWPFLMAAMLVVIVAGYLAVAGHRPRPQLPDHPAGDDDHLADQRGMLGARRRLAWVLVVSGVAGYFLALGSQGPTGALFRWAYNTVPFFDIMREPQKFLMLTALAYAVGLGWGVERLVGSPRNEQPAGQSGPSRTELPRRRAGSWVAAVAIGVVLPLAYSPTIFDGLAGQIGPSTVPAGYRQADRLMGDGPGRILYLPWHLYESQPFTGGRVVANVGASFFRRSAITGQNVQVGLVQTQSTSQTGAYLTHLYSIAEGLRDFGADVAALGVKYVVLAKTADWRSDLWLGHQSDLHLVFGDASLLVWKNFAYHGPGQRSGAARPVRQLSLVAYQIPSGAPGVAGIDATYQKGWRLDGRKGRPSPEGTVEFAVGHAGGIARFQPWGLVKLGYALSGGVFVILAVMLGWDTSRRRRALRAGAGQPDR